MMLWENQASPPRPLREVTSAPGATKPWPQQISEKFSQRAFWKPGDQSNTPHLREQFLQDFIQSRIDDPDTSSNMLVQELLKLRNIRGNEVSPKHKTYDIHRTHIIDALSAYIDNKVNGLRRQLEGIRQAGHDTSKIDQDINYYGGEVKNAAELARDKKGSNSDNRDIHMSSIIKRYSGIRNINNQIEGIKLNLLSQEEQLNRQN